MEIGTPLNVGSAERRTKRRCGEEETGETRKLSLCSLRLGQSERHQKTSPKAFPASPAPKAFKAFRVPDAPEGVSEAMREGYSIWICQVLFHP